MTDPSFAVFDEDRFPPTSNLAEAYQQEVTYGYEVMKERSVVIAGLARNIEKAVPITTSRIERLGELFQDYRVVLYENDSRDRTPELLQAWADSNSSVDLTSERRGDPVNPQIRCLNRAARMAHYRNQCRLKIAEKYPDVDNVIVLDTDLTGGWSYDGIAHTFSKTEAWDFVGSNGIMFKHFNGQNNYPVYFDVWAFRWQGTYQPCFAPKINPRRWNRGEALVPLYSCFGGLGVYRVEAMLRCSYDGSDCEHVPFHRKMREAGMGRIFMNPSQIVLY